MPRPPTKKKFTLDIFDILRRISTKRLEFTVEEKKALQPMVVMRWLSGTQSERQVFILNEFVNRYCFSLSDHKELLINLMAVATDGRMQKYAWLKRKPSAGAKTKMVVEVIREYYDYPTRKAEEVVNILDPDSIREFAESMGYQKDQMKALEKELKLL